MKVPALTLAALLAIFLASGAAAATLVIRIQNVDAKGGTLRVSLYDESGWVRDEDTPLASANVAAVAPETTITLTNVAPGDYGIKMYQDANNNGRFDQNFFGLPLERYGFSRDAQPILSTPAFRRTRFTVGEGTTEITVHLR